MAVLVADTSQGSNAPTWVVRLPQIIDIHEQSLPMSSGVHRVCCSQQLLAGGLVLLCCKAV